MFRYSLANLTISSEFEINYLPTSLKYKVDLEIKLQDFPKHSDSKPYHSWLNEDLSQRLNFYNFEDDYYLEYPNLISFCITNNQILCEKKVDTNYFYLHLLTDQIIPLYLSLTHLVLHASAFTFQDYQIILLGKSGSGKSTLVNKLYPLGKFICDDFLPIKINKDTPELIPTYPGIRLIGEDHQKNVTLIPKELFASSLKLQKTVIVCLDRNQKIESPNYKISIPQPEDLYPLLLSELIQLNPNQASNLLSTFNEINLMINKIRIINLSYNNLLDVDGAKFCQQIIK